MVELDKTTDIKIPRSQYILRKTLSGILECFKDCAQKRKSLFVLPPYLLTNGTESSDTVCPTHQRRSQDQVKLNDQNS